jgi:hypothetical protein
MIVLGTLVELLAPLSFTIALLVNVNGTVLPLTAGLNTRIIRFKGPLEPRHMSVSSVFSKADLPYLGLVLISGNSLSPILTVALLLILDWFLIITSLDGDFTSIIVD